MARRAIIPFKISGKYIRTINDLKQALSQKENLEEILIAIKDGRLKRFLKGFGKQYDVLFEEGKTDNDILESLAEMLDVEIDTEKITDLQVSLITNNEELLQAIKEKRKTIKLAKGHFKIEEPVELDFPVEIVGFGINESHLRFEKLFILNENVSFKDLTIEVDTLVMKFSINELKNVNFNVKSYIKSINIKEVLESQNSNFNVVKDYLSDSNIHITDIQPFLKKGFIVQNQKLFIDKDLILENTNITFLNCKLEFGEDAGLVIIGGKFIAENTQFCAKNSKKGWKNISIIRKTEGIIKNCIFEHGRGRSSNQLNSFKDFMFDEDLTLGGGLFIDKDITVRKCEFYNCSADKGGGIFSVVNNTISNCKFNNCTAKEGDKIFDLEGEIRNEIFYLKREKYNIEEKIEREIRSLEWKKALPHVPLLGPGMPPLILPLVASKITEKETNEIIREKELELKSKTEKLQSKIEKLQKELNRLYKI